MGRRVVGAGVAGDRAGRVGLVDHDRHAAALVLVVGATGEHPVGRAARGVREAGAEVQAAARRAGIRPTPTQLPLAPCDAAS